MLRIILYLWQLPQNIIGFVLTKILRAKKVNIGNDIVYLAPLCDSAISLGNYIIVDKNLYTWISEFSFLTTIQHEQGHQVQSKYLGWLYLLIVGIPSLLRNLYSRTGKTTSEWYYSGFPENWADKLGGVKRN